MALRKIVVFGAMGTIGSAIVAALSPGYEIIPVSRRTSKYKADLTDIATLRALFGSVGKVDGVISAAGEARFKPFAQLTDEDFAFTLANKLMGQVNLVRVGMDHVNDGAAIVLTSGVLAGKPIVGSAVISLVNCGLEGFARAAALEAPRGIRVNVVSPPWVSETLTAMGMDPAGGKPAAQVARAYVEALEGRVASGAVVAA